MAQKTKLPFDEISALARDLITLEVLETQEKDGTEDVILSLLIMAYAFGFGANPQAAKAESAIYKEVDGKTWKERVDEYIDERDVENIYRVIDTDAHRLFETGKYDKAKADGKKYKTWLTMLDKKVRDTHSYLEGMQIGIDDDFYTWDGDYAQKPGDFTLAENNVNCRCILEYS